MKRFTLTLVDSQEQAKSVVEKLTLAGFPERDISVLFGAQGGAREPAGEKTGALPETTVIRPAVGGTVGDLVDLGVPESEAKRYAGAVKDGSILISVHTDNSDLVREAKQIFDQTGAHDVLTTGETDADRRPADEPGVPAAGGTGAQTVARTEKIADIAGMMTGGFENSNPAAPVRGVLGAEGTGPAADPERVNPDRTDASP